MHHQSHKFIMKKQFIISDEQSLDNAGVRVTAVRLLIWRTIRHQFHDAFSLADLEQMLPTVDRSTLFRSLTVFTEAHLLHEIDDGQGLRSTACVTLTTPGSAQATSISPARSATAPCASLESPSLLCRCRRDFLPSKPNMWSKACAPVAKSHKNVPMQPICNGGCL